MSHSQENNSDFVLVHDDELIGILERDAEAPDSEPGSSSVVPHAPSMSDSIQKIIGNLRDSDSGLTVLQCVYIEIVIIVLIIACRAERLETQPAKQQLDIVKKKTTRRQHNSL
jgi:hypothetical protein